MIVLVLVGIAVLFLVAVPFIWTGDSITADVANSFAARSVFADAGPATANVTALAEHARATSIFKFHRVMIENFAVFLAGADLPTAHAVRTNRMRLFVRTGFFLVGKKPVRHVEI